MKIRRALLSVFDKEGIAGFAAGLEREGVELISTGGTFRHLQESGISVRQVSDVTGSPEILDGRVKTLHPKIHGGILARRNVAADLRELKREGIIPIDLVAVNLYPFEETVNRPGASFDDIIENIDIGGPTMLRAAAKNHRDVLVVVRPERYEEILSHLQDGGSFDAAFRERLAREAFLHSAEYDAAISAYFASRAAEQREGLSR